MSPSDKIVDPAFEPFLSPYLSGGYKEDELIYDRIAVEEGAIVATCSIGRHFLPPGGVFHLTLPLIFIAVAQLSIIYAHIDNGLLRKESEVFVHAINLKCKRPVVGTRDIHIRLEVLAKRVMAGGVFYVGNIDVAEKSFQGRGTFLLPLSSAALPS